ncbi:MAG: polysaccharide deacetylase family protein [Candidatus Sulfotelmatobacter sp.]
MSFRFDRFVTLYLVNPLGRGASGNKPSIPILMYHSIGDEDETGVQPYYRTATTPSVFALHMKHLADHGYSTINVADAVKFLQNGSATKKYAVITFDDGYSNFFRHAFPVLERYHFSATVFLPTAYIGTEPIQFKGKDCLTWSEVRELRKHGVCFGSHTATHPHLTSLDAAGVRSELMSSKQTLEDNLGEAVESFAYPYAFPENDVSFVQMLRETLVDAGYRQGVSTRIGTARPQEDCYFLRRLPMNAVDDVPLFDAKLRGAYDWLSSLQYASKLIKGRAPKTSSTTVESRTMTRNESVGQSQVTSSPNECDLRSESRL